MLGEKEFTTFKDLINKHPLFEHAFKNTLGILLIRNNWLLIKPLIENYESLEKVEKDFTIHWIEQYISYLEYLKKKDK